MGTSDRIVGVARIGGASSATEFDRIKTVNDLEARLHAKVAAKAKQTVRSR